MANDSQTTSAADGNQTDEVAAALKGYTADDKGKVVIPDGTPQHVVTALKLEQQRRDANSGYGRERSRADKAEAKAKALEEQIALIASPASLNAEQLAELEELKFTDPDEWFKRKSAIEKANQSQVQEKVTNAVDQASKKAETEYTNTVAKRRDESVSEMLTTHNTLNPDTPITMEMLNANIPPILVQKYHSGELDGAGLLAQAAKFIYADRVIKTEPVVGQPSLGDSSSSTNPTEGAETASLEQLYAGI